MKTFSNHLLALLSALIIIAGGAGTAFMMQKGSQKLPIAQLYSPGHTNAVWDWSRPDKQDTNQIKDNAVTLKSHEITTIYLDISAVQEFMTTDGKAMDTQQDFSKACEKYIKIMNSQGISVFAAAGNTDWSKPSKRSVPLNILKFVETYNSQHSNKFAGMEFDIEAYNQSSFPDASFTEKSLVLMEFLDTVDLLATETQAYNATQTGKVFELGFAIPYWYDNENGNIKSVSWHDKTGPTLYHILDRLNELQRSNVVVMAYRNAATGNDGILYHSRIEIEYAQSKSRHVRIIIGVETTNVEPAKITFYGKTQTELSSEVEQLSQNFDSSGVYEGIAINDMQGYLVLINNK